jgi:SCP-2 sterol transfer family/Mycothiol maleylpyruvate isomerase N-terminal domain
VNETFDPLTLAEDLCEVHRIYKRFFATLDATGWDTPVKGGAREWTLHETVAHLCALNGAGLASIQHTLHGEPYTFTGLDSRYKFNAYNRKGIDDHLALPRQALFAELFGILDEAAGIARTLQPGQADVTIQMPIYNRPVRIVEALSIIMIHTGLFHTAQVAEPARQLPLWMQLASAIRHRVIGRTMRAFSLLYRRDFGGELRATLVFRVDGPGGGAWFVRLSPESPASGEGRVAHSNLVIQLRDTAVFCRMLTGRLNLPLALLSGQLRLRGDLRLFLRMNTLFSVDARPHGAARGKRSYLPEHLAERSSK